MKRFLVVLIASFFLASAAYAADVTKDPKEASAATKSEKASKEGTKAKSKSKSSKEKDESKAETK